MGNRITTASLHQYAKERGGKFLSEKYRSSDPRQKWQCSKGHIWYTLVRKINVLEKYFGIFSTNCSDWKLRYSVQQMPVKNK
jgi:hypothetical protein